jgi:hypothetical protein
MPVTDGDFLLRDGSTLLNSAEGTGDGVLVGPCPLNGMLLMMNLPVDGTQLICQIEESDDDSSYTLVADPGQMTIAVGVKTYLPRIFWTKRYLRLNVTTCTGSFGYAIFGLVQGGEPVAYA